MMFLEANKKRCKTVFDDNSQELEVILTVIHNKNTEENYEVQWLKRCRSKDISRKEWK